MIKLLHANGRATGEQLAQQLHYSAGACRSRLRHLFSSRIFVKAQINPARIGLHLMANVGLKVQPAKIWAALERLRAHERVYFAGTVTGIYDLFACVACASTSDLTEFLETFVGGIDGVKEIQMSIVLERIRGHPTLDAARVARLCKDASLPPGLDSLDLSIIGYLSEDGRVSSRVLARRTGVSYVTIRRRVQHLLDCGTVRVSVMLDPVQFGYGITAFVAAKVRLSRWRTIASALAEHRQFHVVYTAAGMFDILLAGTFRSIDDLDDHLRICAKRIEGIESLHTFICTSGALLVPPDSIGIE